MATPQPGIFAQGTRSHYYLEYDLQPGSDRAAFIDALRAMREPPVTAGGANLVVGFGRRLWELLSPDGVPSQLRDFEPLVGRTVTAPATQHDLWLWTHGTNDDVTVDVARAATVALGPVATLASEQPAFVYKESRDFFGFIDGTENPEVWDAHLVTLIPDGEKGVGGSYVLTMKWVHDLGRFNALDEDEQERIIGRTKADSVELDDDVRPDSAHISRVVIEDNEGEEREIYRRSTPFGSVTEQGLNFVGFGNDLELFCDMLQRMLGTSGDGLHDRITEFSTPARGAFYFAPSLDALHALVNEA
ncbi:MAG: Dyp-type peroxidase [Actinomycetota bacterium]|nr:Dyp-type peroxidase [Actinomycetota bacterium]